MPPKFLTCDQNSAEWFEARRGRITASRIVDVLSFLSRKSKNGGRGDPAKAHIDYLKELRGERITGKTTAKHYVSPYMDHGMEYEHVARIAFKAESGLPVMKVGFAIHPELDYSGASVDALAGDRAIVEIKCPQIETHLDYREAGIVPPEYEHQCQWGMEVCQRESCYFVSFHPDAPDDLRIFTARLDYNPSLPLAVQDISGMKTYREAVENFNTEIEDAIARLRGGSTLNAKLRESLEVTL